MYINDVNKKEEIRNIATQHLRKYGIKFRPKKPRSSNQVTKYGKKFFKVPLQNLETETITLKNGQQLVIPKRLHEICVFIVSKVYTEGIFRKEGSKSRQNEIKLSLDRGCMLGDEHHVIDVAVVLKVFLRELPEPLIPSSYHELFLRCSLIEKKLDAIHLACLLLPTDHLNVLTYLMQFFNEVGSCSEYNKMTFSNLAIVVGPNIFPIDEKIQPKSQLMLAKTCDIIKIMIENGDTLGFIPDYIIEEIGNSDTELDKRKKKRRSGSLTRMFNGLKKIVTSKVEEDNNTNIVTPDLLLTPCISRSMKKRKVEASGLSTKKKKELLNKLPECALLNTPFTPSRTPISANPNGKKTTVENEVQASQEMQKEKKLHWYMRSRSMKNLKDESEKDGRSRRSSFGPRAMLERRWSAVSQAANFRKKKTNPSISSSSVSIAKSDGCPVMEKNAPQATLEADYVRVSKAEYEEIKSRVSAIERRISMELETVESQMSDDESNANNKVDEEVVKKNNIENVQNAYKHTLEQAENLSPTTDQLARRLSKELRIRRSTEQKIIRSPSARKIGSLRRRSREMEKKNVKLNRHQSWHVGVAPQNLENNTATIPRVNLQRKTSTPIGSERQHFRKPLTEISLEDVNVQIPYNLRKSSPHIQTSYDTNSHISQFPKHSKMSCNTSGSSTEHWTSAEGFFSSEKTSGSCPSTDRASLAKLRQNAGVVLAKARLFDTMKDSDNSNSIKSIDSPKRAPQSKNAHRIGAARNSEARMSYRVRTLRNEDRKSKKSMSPRRRNLNVSYRQRIQAAKQYADTKRSKENRMNVLATPLRDSRMETSSSRGVPQIKKPLLVRSPKRLCRTPVADKMTPLKVLATPRFDI